MKKYNPSQEDFKKAANSMTRYQREVSLDREEQQRFLKNMGVEGYFTLLGVDKEKRKAKFKGEINEHEVVVQMDNLNKKFEVKIDEFDLTPGESHNFIKRYWEAMKLGDSQMDWILDEIQKDVAAPVDVRISANDDPNDPESAKKFDAVLRRIILDSTLKMEQSRQATLKEIGL